MTVKDETGAVYGRLTVLYRTCFDGKNQMRWLCRCECGNLKEARGTALRGGRVKSCGCLQKDVRRKHGLSTTPEYRTLHGAKMRCRKDSPDQPYYKARGIEYRFPDDMAEALKVLVDAIGFRPPNPPGRRSFWSLDRINNDGHYEPGNVRWATPSEQQGNRRSFAKLATPIA